MNQSPLPDPSLDGVLNALRSDATAEELSGEASAISAMVSAIAVSAEGISSMNQAGRTPLTRPTFSRARRIVGLTAIGVLGVAGVAAAGAGVFVPDNRPKVETVPGNDDSDDTAVETTMVDDESTETTAPADTTSATDNEQDDQDEQDEAAANKTPADGSIAADATDTSIVCADGNHGMTVSSVAHATPPGPGHGEAVSAAAHSDCGKGSESDSIVVDTTAPGSEDTTDTTMPKDKGHKPDDPGSQGGNGNGNGNGNGGGNGNGNGNGNGGGNGNPATIWKGKGG